MNIYNKLLQIQRGVKRQRIFIVEESDDENDENFEPLNEAEEEATIGENDENSEPEVEEEQEQIQFENGKTNKGGLCLWHKGFRYVRDGRCYWKCSVAGCKARAKVTDIKNGFYYGKIRKKYQHIHLPEPQRQLAEEKRSNAKRMIRENPSKKPGKIMTEARDGESLEVIEKMGNNQAMNMMICREKGNLFGNVNSRKLLDIHLTNDLIMMEGNSILLYDSRERNRPNQADVVMVFAHEKLLQLLKKKKKWSVDGTFRVAPKPWKQCFVVGAFVNSSQIVVCAHALLPGKHAKYYAEALESIKVATRPSNPIKIISDFEQSILKAVKAIFPTTNSMGCMFHFSQAIFRKWRSLGLEALMVDEEIGENVRHTFRRVLALPLIPIEQVRRAFSLIIDDASPNVSHFLMYFAEVYIGFTEIELQIGANAFVPGVNIRRSTISTNSSNRQTISSNLPEMETDHNYSSNVIFGRPSPRPSTPTMTTSTEETIPVRRWEMEIIRRPMYEINFWNVHQEALHALARTNNSMEATHRHYQKGLNFHPALSDFLLAFKDDVRKQLAKEQVASVFPPKRNRRDVIREQNAMYVLNDAEYDEDADLLDLVTLLGIQMQGYIAGLREMAKHDDANRTEDTINLNDEASIYDWDEELEPNQPEIDHSSVPSTSSQSQ